MQKFDGFLKLPHDIVQALIINHLTGCENQLIFVILALTTGFNKKNCKITLSYFQQATGINQQQAFDLLKRLESRGIVIITRTNNVMNLENKKTDTPLYEINWDTTAWQSTQNKSKKENKNNPLGVYRKTSQELPTPSTIQQKYTKNEDDKAYYYANNEYSLTPKAQLMFVKQQQALQHPISISQPPTEHVRNLIKKANVRNIDNNYSVRNTDITHKGNKDDLFQIDQHPKLSHAPFPHSESNTPILKNQYTHYHEFSNTLLKNQYDLYQNLSNLYKDKYKDNYKKINTKNNSLKENAKDRNKIFIQENIQSRINTETNNKRIHEAISELILFSAQECQLTIIGNNVELLAQLLAIHSKQLIQTALMHFKTYQDVPKDQRKFYLSNNFKSFADKFDSFCNPQGLAELLEKETRWFTEARTTEKEKKNHSAPNGMNPFLHTNKEEETEEIQTEAELKEEQLRETKANYLLAKKYVSRILNLAESDHTTIEHICHYFKEPIIKFERSKAIVDEYEKSQQAA